MELRAELVQQALAEALEKHSQFAEFGPKLARRELFRGHTYFVEYDRQPPADAPGLWDFQNDVVKGYKRLAGE